MLRGEFERRLDFGVSAGDVRLGLPVAEALSTD
jgi:hypothetical protein